MVQYELATNTENYQCIIHYIWFKNIILGPVHASLELQPYDWGFSLERVSWCNENKTQVSVTLKMRAWQIKMGMCLMCIDIFVSQSSDDICESIKSCKKSFKFIWMYTSMVKSSEFGLQIYYLILLLTWVPRLNQPLHCNIFDK